MKNLVVIILVALATQIAQARELTTTTQKEIGFLSSLRDLVFMAHQVNIAHTHAFKACIEGLTESFPYQFPKSSEEWSTALRSCQETVRAVLKDRIRKKYPEMRLALAMSEPEVTLTSAMTIENIDSPDPLKFSSELKHPAGKNAAELQPLTEEEKQVLRVRFHERTGPACWKYFQTHPELNASFCWIYSLDPAMRAQAKARFFDSRYPHQPEAQKIFIESYFRKHRKVWSQNKKDYFALIQNFPLLLYVSSAEPSDTELSQALDRISANAQEAFHEMRERDQELALEGRLHRFWAGETDERAETILSGDLRVYLDYGTLLDHYLGVYLPKLKEMGINKEIYQPLIDAHASGTAFFGMVKNAGLIAANFGCVLVPEEGLVVSLLGRLAARGGCFTALNIPLTAYFLYDIRETERESIITTLSSPEGKYVLADLRQLKSSEFDQFMTAAFLGVASLQGLREIARLIGVSEATAEWASQFSRQLRPLGQNGF